MKQAVAAGLVAVLLAASWPLRLPPPRTMTRTLRESSPPPPPVAAPTKTGTFPGPSANPTFPA